MLMLVRVDAAYPNRLCLQECYNKGMVIFAMFTWWYGPGWKAVAREWGKRLDKLSGLFSVPILLRTLFSPWRRIITYPGASFDAQIRAMIDNMVSRVVGFTVRFFVLIAAGIMLLVAAVLGGVWVLVWPLLPLAVPALLFKGFVG